MRRQIELQRGAIRPMFAIDSRLPPWASRPPSPAAPRSMKPIHGIPTSVIVVVSVLVLLHAAALAWWLKKAVEKPQKGWGTLEGKKKT